MKVLSLFSRLGTVVVTALFLLSAFPGVVRAEYFGDFTYECNAGSITLTDYAGGDAPEIPSFINGTNVTSIGDYAFQSCSSLVSVTIPGSITNIGVGAFSLCNSLSNVTIPSSIASIRDGTFLDCSSLGNIAIPDSVITIGESVFSGCSSLTNVMIPYGVTSIGDYTFWKCYSLKRITIPSSFTQIGGFVFLDCTNLTDVTIGTNVTSIGSAAFQNCTGLTNITIPSSVTNIGMNAFWDCSNLSSITIPNSVTGIGDGAFGSISGSCLTNVTIGTNVTSIGAMAFVNCCNLTSVIIPNSVTSIGYMAFGGCSSMTKVTISTNAASIEARTFQYCTSLTSVTIPDSVTNIGYEALFSCTGLTNFTVGKGVTFIRQAAFAGCSNLAGAYFRGDAPYYDSPTDIFQDDTNATVYRMPGAAGWPPVPDEWATRPTALWVARIIGVSGNLAFGSVTTGTTVTAIMTITNSGNMALTVTNITYPAGFSGAWSGTIQAGKATNVTVRFAPVALTAYSGTVTVVSSRTSGGNTISVSGTGTAKIIGLSGNLAFGSVTAGTTATATLTITNSGNATLTVTGITYPPGFSGAWAGTIAARGSHLVTVTFAPTALQSCIGTVTVNSDKTSGTATIGASGIGLSITPETARRPTLTWSPTAGATYYQLLIYRNGVTYYSQWLHQTINTWTAETDFKGSNYQWWVRSYVPAIGTGAWQGPGTFTIATILPGAISLTGPSGTVVTDRPQFTWSADAATTWYNILIKRDDVTYQNKLIATVASYTPTSNIPLGTYQWWVRGWNPDGYGPWSSSTSFVYGLSTPLAPAGVVAGTRRPTFYWTAVPGASYYKVYVKKAGVSYQQQWAAGATSLTFAVDMPGTNYQWWVQTWNSKGYGPWSTGATYSIPFAAPGVTVPVSPVGTATGAMVSYVWQADPNATHHELYIQRNNVKWSDKWYPAASKAGLLTNNVSGHTAGAVYKWFVRGWGPDGYGEWSAMTTFVSN